LLVLCGCKIWSLIFKRRKRLRKIRGHRRLNATGDRRGENDIMKSTSIVCSTNAIRMIKGGEDLGGGRWKRLI
jgi:hypothetical protein